MDIDLVANATILKRKVENQLEQLIHIADKFEVFRSIEFAVEDSDKVDFSLFDISNVVYLIQIADFGNAVNGRRLCSSIAGLKKKSKIKFKLPKVNVPSDGDSVLYIGKSSGSFKNRMEQHLLGKSETTFALHLNKWNNYPKEFEGLRFKLYFTEIKFNQLGIDDKNEQKDLLELVETSLHQNYKPLLGRSGH